MSDILQLNNKLLCAWNDHDTEQLILFYAPDYEGMDVDGAEPYRGREGVRAWVNLYWQAFPDLRFKNEEVLVEGNRVAAFWRSLGTHKGVFMRIPPTHRTISVRGVSRLTYENDLIKHGFYIWDVAGLLRSIGLLPER